jgi:hypothetical protein
MKHKSSKVNNLKLIDYLIQHLHVLLRDYPVSSQIDLWLLAANIVASNINAQ